MMDKNNNLAREENNESSAKSDIKQALHQANTHSVKRKAKQSKLSSNFLTRLKQEKQEELRASEAEQICEKAMLTLSTEYISKLELLKDATTAKSISQALQESEQLWKSETQKILQHDPQNTEAKFFQEMRSFLFLTLSQKLENFSKKAKYNPSEENIKTAQEILGLQDKILEELGHPADSLDRIRVQEIKNNFKI